MTAIRSYQANLLGLCNARLSGMLRTRSSHTLVPGIGNPPRMVTTSELQAIPYPSLVTRGRPRHKDLIGFFGISLSDYGIWDDIYGGDHVSNVFINDHAVYAMTGYGFAIYHGIRGIADGGGLHYCSRVFLHDTTSRITVDSHLPVDFDDLHIFERDFQLLMIHLRKMGLDPHTTSAKILYGAAWDASEYGNEAGTRVADVVMHQGISSCTRYPVFDDGADHYISLNGSHVRIVHTKSYMREFQQRRQKLHEYLQPLSLLCDRILDISVQRAHEQMPGLILSMIEILKSQNDLLQADGKFDVDFMNLDVDSNETIVTLKGAIEHMIRADFLAHVMNSELIDEWTSLMGEYSLS